MQRDLVDLAKHGDGEAFDALARMVGDRCMAIACRILRDADLAEDAVQAALITAWRDLRALRDPDRFEPWLHRILANACYAEARRRRRSLAEIRVLPVEATYGPDETFTVLVFHHYVGLPVSDVADRLDIPVGTVKSRLHHATAALRASLEADARTPSMKQERLA